jgi:methionyl-tRNA formyltransferase
MKLIFMGTPDFAVAILQSLIGAGHEILSVVTQPDRPVGRKQTVTAPPVKLLAIKHEITVLQPLKLRTPDAIENLGPVFTAAEAIVVAAYGRILPDWILEAPRFGCLNVHSSLLPKYRGAAPINWAIANGEGTTGVTTMQMDAGLDTGAILLQRTTQIGESETAIELTSRLAVIGADLMVETLQSLVAGTLSPSRQDDSEATYAPILKREDGVIDWNMTGREILNRKRGFTPFPGCYTIAHHHRLEIVEAATEEALEESQRKAGEVVAIEKTSFSVQCGSGTLLRITEVQPEGRRAMPVRDYLNGASIAVGARLGEE